MISDLQRIVAARVDELRDEGAEEDERLRIADRDEESLQEEADARHGELLALAERAGRAEELHAEIDEIGGADEPYDLEPPAERLDQRGEADADQRDHERDAELRPGDVEKPGAAPCERLFAMISVTVGPGTTMMTIVATR